MSSTVVNQYKNGVYNYLSFGNPIAWLNSPGYNNQQNYTFLGNMGADWELIKGLHFRPSFFLSLQRQSPAGIQVGGYLL